jgi:hypothetical protein
MRSQYRNLILILSITLFQVKSEIDIWSPPELKSLYKNKVFEYSIANFGTVPYGHSIIGTVKKSVPFDGCKKMSSIRNTNDEGALILLIMRGGCHFADKVINAQKIGAKMVIILDNLTEDVHSIMPVERGKNLLNKVRFSLFGLT